MVDLSVTNGVKTPLNRFRLDGHVAIVTGGGNGIGRATAELLVEAGAAVALIDRDERAVEDTKVALLAAGAQVEAYIVDVTDEAAIEASCASVAHQWGRLDILVNNAGISIRRPTMELSLADWNSVVAVNMTAVFLGCRAAARHMLRRGTGSIVNTASIMGLSGGGLYPNVSYQATKGGVVNLTRALAVEWARQGIRVNAVAPTWVKTQFIANLTARPELMAEIARVTPLGRLAEPDEIAAAILFLASPAASMITGHILTVDGGFLAQ
jgi:NAD(P)-dependent dehydrogenase (short-subunit alcohol dehydrogenase family)